MKREKAKAAERSEDGKAALVPKLRFPEFREPEGWQVKKLSSSVQLVSGMHLSPEQYSKEGTVPYFTGPSDFTNDIETITKRTSDSASLAKKDDVLITVKGSGVGEIWYLTLSTVAIGRQLMAVRAVDTASRFVFQTLLTKRRRFEDLAAGNLIPGLSRGDILDLEIPFPRLAEQQRIAECLSSLDDLMAAQARKVDALKVHKKGLMQQLFPGEGETQPRLRYPEFQNTGKWGEVALGEIAEIKLGKMLDSQKHSTGRLLPYLNNMSVRWNEVNTSNLPKMHFDEDELDRFGLRYGDVVVCEGGEPGRAAVWDGRLPDLKFQKAIHRVRFNVPFEPLLLVLHLENLAGTTQFEMLFTGGGIKHLTRETFVQLKIPLIPYAEQQRLVTCCTTLDDLITAETRKLEALKTHKRGLTQQLFPSLENQS